LAISSQLVEMLEGIISADSPGEGLGAVFTVELPLASAFVEAPAAEAVAVAGQDRVSRERASKQPIPSSTRIR
jgi:hypothetical protein